MPSETDSVFLDTDVLLDHLADRQPFSEFAHRIFALAESGLLKVHVSALAICNLYYLLRKLQGHECAIALLGKLTLLAQVTPVGDREVRPALGAGRKDFEDSVQIESAGAVEGIGVLITRNARDYIGSKYEYCRLKIIWQRDPTDPYSRILLSSLADLTGLGQLGAAASAIKCEWH
jgi:predicted nucleic acid-binding protein